MADEAKTSKEQSTPQKTTPVKSASTPKKAAPKKAAAKVEVAPEPATDNWTHIPSMDAGDTKCFALNIRRGVVIRLGSSLGFIPGADIQTDSKTGEVRVA